jgi:putative ABC transport system permease protein
VVGEVAIALVLLAGAGLLMRSFARLLDVDPGFDPRNAVTLRVNLDDSAEARARPGAFAQAVVDQIAALPGVRAAAVASRLPFVEAAQTAPFSVAGWPQATDADRPVSIHYYVGPDYFRAMGIPLLRGRSFQLGDTQAARRWPSSMKPSPGSSFRAASPSARASPSTARPARSSASRAT